MTIKKLLFLTAAIVCTGIPVRTASAAGQTITIAGRQVPPPATVAVIRDNSVNYATMVAQALEAALGAGGISNLVHSGQTVVIKPNLVSNNVHAVTDWRIVRALVDQIKTVNGGANITIAEASATNSSTSNTRTIMAAQGYTAANFPGVTLLDLNNLTECPTNNYVLTDGASDNTTKRVAALIYEADVFIDMPKMKTHYHAGFTGAVKNIGIGVPSWMIWNTPGSNNNKGGLHNDIRREILDHILTRVPDLTVMDAIQAMEGQGPVSGNPVTMNCVLASRDPVAIDAVACDIMNIPPYLITHLVLVANENVGIIDLNHITVTGNVTVNNLRRSFLRATPGGLTPPYELSTIPYRATTVIRTAPLSGVTIDGNLAEWGHANFIEIDAADQVKNANSWNGKTDCGVTGIFMYDETNLYFAAYVKDDIKLPNTATGASIRNGECLELYFSTYTIQYDNNHGTTYMSDYDHILGVSYADNPQAYMFSHNREVSGFSASKVETSDGYLIEAKIPLNNFNNMTISRYRQIGINVGICDADASPSTVSKKMYWNMATQSDVETNPQRLGMSYLDPQGGIYAVPQCTLTVHAVNGTVAASPAAQIHNAYTLVTLTATPDSGYIFTGWSDSVSENPRTLLMRYSKDITANFGSAPVLNSIFVSPASVTLFTGGQRQFSAIAYGQNNQVLSPQPTFSWTVIGTGTITTSGLYSAGSSAGSATVFATVNNITGSANVLINAQPTTICQINTGSSSAASPFTGDQYGSGGTMRTVTNSIDRSAVS
ncbi:MAG: DUF362 domain-containing protein, partial [Chitinispirillaceae bacterium]|nr:DUF362 domain-containing protein [Chitinispirillaceae bacterium]